MKPARTLSIVALAALAVPLAACSSDSDDAESRALSLGNVLQENHPWNTCGSAVFQDELEGADVGLTLDVFPAGQTQADTLEQLDALQSGTLDVTYAGPAQLATRVEALNIFDAAYLFRDVDHMVETLDGELAAPLLDELIETSDLRVLATGYYGTRHVTANQPVRSPEDLSGVKMRVIDAPLWIDNAVALGAEPAPVAFAELYLALQQGVVDSQENPLPTISAQKFDEVQSHISLTAHNIGAEHIVVGEQLWQSLSEEQQQALDAAAKAGAQAATECVAEEEEELLEVWSSEDSGIEIVSDVDYGAFQERALEILQPKYGDLWGDLFAQIQDS